MPIVRLGLRLTAARARRIAVFFLLLLLLCAGAGLIGAGLLYSDRAVDLITVAVVDEDDTMETRLFYNFLGGMVEYADLIVFERMDGAEADTRLDAGQVTAVLVIPPGFTQSVLVGENDPFTILLDSESPLKTGMISLFVDAYTDMLRTGQIGVFSALDIARAQGGSEAYDAMFRAANLRFLTAMLSRGPLQQTEYVSATGTVDTAVYYAAAAWVFLGFLGSVLFLDQYRQMTAKPVLARLRAGGMGPLRCTLELLTAAALPFLLVALLGLAGLALAGGWLGLEVSPAAALPGMLMSALCAGAFCVAVALLLRSEMAGSVFATLFSLLCLFLSGGVLPVAYFSAPLQMLARLTPNYWLSGALTGAAGGGLAGGLVAFGLLAALCWLGVARRGKAGGAL